MKKNVFITFAQAVAVLAFDDIYDARVNDFSFSAAPHDEIEQEIQRLIVEAIELLSDSILAEDVMLYGAEEGGNGNIQAVPLSTLLRDDYTFDLKGNQLCFTRAPWPTWSGKSPEEARKLDRELRRQRANDPRDWAALQLKARSINFLAKPLIVDAKQAKKPSYKAEAIAADLESLAELPKTANKELRFKYGASFQTVQKAIKIATEQRTKKNASNN